MDFKLPDPKMGDAGFLAANMTDANYINGGGNNDVWRIDGLTLDSPYVVRISKHHRELFLSVDQPPRIAMRVRAAIDARAAQPVAVFLAHDRNGKEVQVADIQPEMRGILLGLTNAQRDTRSTKTIYTLSEPDGWGRPAGTQSARYETNTEGVQATNAIMWPVVERIAAMSQSFFIQAIKDVRELEEQGYAIDPSKASNFMLIADENRLGFVDLMTRNSAATIAPATLANVLWQPANQTWSTLDTKQDQSRRSRLRDIIVCKVIDACDDLNIAYGTQPRDLEDAARVRAIFGRQAPQGEASATISARDIVVPKDRPAHMPAGRRYRA